MGIPRKQKPTPAAGEFLFQFDPEPWEECVTANAGIPLFLQAARSLDVPERVRLPHRAGFPTAYGRIMVSA